MRFNDLICISFRQVLRYRRRYLGVMLAIALGVAGFTTTITMSRDFKRNINRDLTLIGGVTCIKTSFLRFSENRPEWFHDESVTGLQQLPGVEKVSLVAMGNARSLKHGRNHNFMVAGVDRSFWEVRGFWPLRGELFGPEEIDRRQRTCVLGADLAQELFGTTQVEGFNIEINQDLYRISGVLGGVTVSDLSRTAILPLTTAQDRIAGLSPSSIAYLRCLTWDDVPSVAKAIPGVIQAHQPTDQLHVEGLWEALKRVQHVAWWVEFFIYLAVSATLLLGGAGIWNVMMAAVRSRTREIGLKKAMGAEDRDILAQFLSEALCLSLGGALAGVALGRLTMEVLGFCLDIRPPEGLFFLCLILGLLFAVGLGVGAGLYPSIQASRMEVVSAIRYE